MKTEGVNIRTFSSPREEEYLKAQQGRTALEIGCYVGWTTRLLAERFEKVIVIDTFEGEAEKKNAGNVDVLREFKRNTKRYRNIRILKGCSFLRIFDIDFSEVDFIFIDGGHDYETACGDILISAFRSRTGCEIAVHDTRPSKNKNIAVVQALNRLLPLIPVTAVRYIDSICHFVRARRGRFDLIRHIERQLDNIKYYVLYELGFYFWLFQKSKGGKNGRKNSENG